MSNIIPMVVAKVKHYDIYNMEGYFKIVDINTNEDVSGTYMTLKEAITKAKKLDEK